MRREAAIEYLRGALWAMPTAAVFLALVAGSVLSTITFESGSSLAPLLFQGTVDDARNLLIGIASTMVTVIALVLGLTVVALQLASTQFTDRRPLGMTAGPADVPARRRTVEALHGSTSGTRQQIAVLLEPNRPEPGTAWRNEPHAGMARCASCFA
jgi:hypothetical protein